MKGMKPIHFPASLAFVLPTYAVFFIVLSGCGKQSFSSEKAMDDKSATAQLASPLLGVTINVKSVGAEGDGTTDDTWAFQKAIDSVNGLGGGTVYVPSGAYLVDPDTADCIRMKSNVTLDMVDSTRILLAKPSAAGTYRVIWMKNISNAIVKGGKILGERYQHQGTTGEWGHGMGIYGVTNVQIIGTRIYDCWGDGISIAGTKTGMPGVYINSTNCNFSGIVCKNNRRQGLSIGGVNNLQVLNSVFSFTNGTAPQCGIDIEPDSGQFADGILIQNCNMKFNARQGLLITPKGRMRDVTVKYCDITYNVQRGIQNTGGTKTYIGFNIIHHNGATTPTQPGISIEKNSDSTTVEYNTLYQNYGNPSRGTAWVITGTDSITRKDIFVSPEATNVVIGTNTYK